MDEKHLVGVSRRLSLHLRHRPELIAIVLEPAGWVEVDVLLAALARHDFPVSRAELEEVVERNSKRRFAFDDTGTRIRASQGHTVAVELDLPLATPPDVLFHGTHGRVLDAIRDEGLRSMGRHHVHLSVDPDTARQVGGRRGRPVVLRVDASGLVADGHEFRRSANGVWLVDHVPPGRLTFP